MESFIQLIEKKLKSSLEINSIKIIDNTHQHKKHKSFQQGKFHLKIIIDSKYLSSLSRIQAQKEVFKAPSSGVAMGMYNLDQSIIDFARASLNYGLNL